MVPFYIYIIIGICSLFSMFFSASDLVYAVVDKNKLEKITGKKEKRAKLAIKICDDYEWSISSILFGNNIANIFASSFVTIVGITLNPEIGTAIATTIFTVFVIIFCEYIPKAFAKRFSLSLAIAFVYPVLFVKYVTCFVVWPISQLFKLIVKLFHKRSIEEDKVDEDVLSEMADNLEEQGLLESGEAELVRSAIDLSDIEAYEIMTPRVDMYAIDIEDDINEIIKEGEIFKYSRVPVYEGTIDNIIGVLPIKVLAKKILNKEKNVDISSLCYKPIMVPRNHQILDVLEEFKHKKIHIAIVIDEYGGTDGLITMEDILEEIVGDIFDETDKIEKEYLDEGYGSFIVDGAMNIDDFFELIGYDEEEIETDYATVGGFCQDILDRFAKVGDEFDFSHYHFRVLEADEFTVEKLRVLDLDYKEEKDE